jgi:hypothetical protein
MKPLTWTVRHTCSGKLGIVKLIRYIRSDMYTASAMQEDVPLANGALCLSTPKHPATPMVNLILGRYTLYSVFTLWHYLQTQVGQHSPGGVCGFLQSGGLHLIE